VERDAVEYVGNGAIQEFRWKWGHSCKWMEKDKGEVWGKMVEVRLGMVVVIWPG